MLHSVPALVQAPRGAHLECDFLNVSDSSVTVAAAAASDAASGGTAARWLTSCDKVGQREKQYRDGVEASIQLNRDWFDGEGGDVPWHLDHNGSQRRHKTIKVLDLPP